MQKFPVTVRQMSPGEQQYKERLALADEAANGDRDRIIIVDENTTLVVNRPGFDPNTWPKKLWKRP